MQPLQEAVRPGCAVDVADQNEVGSLGRDRSLGEREFVRPLCSNGGRFSLEDMRGHRVARTPKGFAEAAMRYSGPAARTGIVDGRDPERNDVWRRCLHLVFLLEDDGAT